MEQWVLDWLHEQRELGEKCLEIKYINGKNYVYRSTSKYDKVTKGPKKVSKYVGRLIEHVGLVVKGEKPNVLPSKIKSVTEFGNSLFLHHEFEEIIQLLKVAFPDDWQEIVAMVITRVDGYCPLKRVKDKWEKLANIDKILPNCDPKNLGKVLYRVGQNRSAQEHIFSNLTENEEKLIYDLSYVFSDSENLQIAEKGYNGKRNFLPQVNIALFSGINSHLPLMIRGIPGSVKDVKTLEKSLTELDVKDATLILDRGFISEAILPLFDERRINYVQPLRRNSDFYQVRIHFTKHFNYHNRFIHCGKRKVDNHWIYSFKDTILASIEEADLYQKMESDSLKKDEFSVKIKKAGMILIRSNLDIEPDEVYGLYKSRDLVEKHFETFKSELSADKLYLQDAFSVFGHFFVAFLALYLYCRILNILKGADLNRKYSPKDLIIKFSKVYAVISEANMIITEVPKQVQIISEAINFQIVPKS
jgi:transposase